MTATKVNSKDVPKKRAVMKLFCHVVSTIKQLVLKKIIVEIQSLIKKILVKIPHIQIIMLSKEENNSFSIEVFFNFAFAI